MKKLTTISLFIFFAVAISILTAGLVFYQNNKNGSSNLGVGLTNQNKSTDIVNLISSGITVLDSTEVAKHNTISNCWIIVNNKIYDISGYASAHPGGVRNIADYCGKESTQAYDTKGGRGNPHSATAYQELTQFYIGDLNQKINQNTLAQNVAKAKSNPVAINPTVTPTLAPLPLGVPAGNVVLNSAEVAKHNVIADCWMIINNKIYNLSDYASAHPGGVQNIANYCGKEATQAYDTKGGRGNSHSSSAQSLLAQYYIGDLNQTVNQTTLNQTIQNTQTVPLPTNRRGEYEDD